MNAAPAGRAERRLYPRFVPCEERGPAMARLRPGREAMVVNLSRGGACVEAVSPLRPGYPVDIRLTLPEWQWHGEAQVLRCQVSALPRHERVRYRAGLRFASPVAVEVAGVGLTVLPPPAREDATRRVVVGTK